MESRSPSLSSRQRAHLRALGNPLKPLLMVGKDGITETLLTALDRLLEDHELVKVKTLKSCELHGQEVSDRLREGTGSDLAGHVGRTLLFYRRSKNKPRIVLPE